MMTADLLAPNGADKRRRPLAQPAGKASALIGLLGNALSPPMHLKLALIGNTWPRCAMTRSEIAALLAYVILGHLGILDNKRKKNFECFHRVAIRFLSMVFGLEILMVIMGVARTITLGTGAMPRSLSSGIAWSMWLSNSIRPIRPSSGSFHFTNSLFSATPVFCISGSPTARDRSRLP
jgi:hypothetical protein